jgi:hypothetical protein
MATGGGDRAIGDTTFAVIASIAKAGEAIRPRLRVMGRFACLAMRGERPRLLPGRSLLRAPLQSFSRWLPLLQTRLLRHDGGQCHSDGPP